MISSLVIRLAPQADPALLRARLTSFPGLELGACSEHRSLPVVLEADDHFSLLDATRRIQNLDDVSHVDVVYVHWESDSDAADETESTTESLS